MAESNIDIFDQVTGLIFSTLYQSFPMAATLDVMSFQQTFPDHVDRPGEFFADTVKWLVESGYVVVRQQTAHPYVFEKCTLTAKALEVLKATPKAIGGETLGGKLAAAAKDGAASKLKELTGEILSKGYALAVTTAMNPSTWQ